MRAEAPHEPPPPHRAPPGAEQVGDVRPVEALPLHDERLGPDHLLGGAQTDGTIEQGRRRRVAEPRAWSTIAIPFPELQMRSTTAPAPTALPSQWGWVDWTR